MKAIKLDESIRSRINRSLLSYLILVITSYNLFTYFVTTNYVDQQNQLVTEITKEMNDFDPEVVCNITGCDSITIYTNTNKEITYRSINGSLEKINYEELPSHISIGSLQIFTDLSLGFSTKYNTNIRIPLPSFLIILSISYVVFIILSVSLFRMFLNNIAVESKWADIMNFAGKEAQLSNKNMTLLTEDIHHEMKTPLAIIVNKVDYLREFIYDLQRIVNSSTADRGYQRKLDLKIMGCKMECASCLAFKKGTGCTSLNKNAKIEEAFELIDFYTNSIYNILERMKNFKNIKYSNGNKTLYDIVNASVSTMKLHHKGLFEYLIDDNLKNLKLDHDGLKNEDLLNLFLNHIKNSLEANSTFISINTIQYKDRFIYIDIVDNGNGIPNEALNQVYDPNFSTKSGNGDVRGIGMYLAKSILKIAGGDEEVKETSKSGTVLRLWFPAIYNKEDVK